VRFLDHHQDLGPRLDVIDVDAELEVVEEVTYHLIVQWKRLGLVV
jgi:hypothetical protein